MDAAATERSTADALKKFGYETMIGISNTLTGPGTEDQFEERGMITPEQFVAAGDMLTSKCRTWTWESGDPAKAFDYLPPDKQYLLTRRVPCTRRAREVEGFEAQEVILEGDDGDEGWAMTVTDELEKVSQDEEIPDLDAVSEIEEEEEDEDDIPDIEDFDEGNLVLDQDPAALDAEDDNVLKTRTYDIYITYDQFHQTPKVYLQGYGEDGQILTQEQTFEDIASDYVHKTVSTETHPHLPIITTFIHPCRHAETMQRLLTMMKDSSGTTIRPDQCLFLFLKFISSVIPTVQYDFTATVDVGSS